ncbi:MAG: hypothetical protein ACP6IY_18870, partial [Promethearchaeia archaeon]
MKITNFLKSNKGASLSIGGLFGILLFVLVLVALIDPITAAIAGVHTRNVSEGGKALLGITVLVFLAGAL